MSTLEAIEKLMNEYETELRRLRELARGLSKNDSNYRRDRAVIRNEMYKYNKKWSALNDIKNLF